MCIAQEPQLLDIYVLSYTPLNFVSSSLNDKISSALLNENHSRYLHETSKKY